ncbi:Fc fragment of IgE, low affinity II, receptor for (CD23) [Chamberlinius hualienensis]
MKNFIILSFLIVLIQLNHKMSAGSIIKNDHKDLMVTADQQKVEFYKGRDSESWLQMVLVFSRKNAENESKETTKCTLACPNISTDSDLTTTTEITTQKSDLPQTSCPPEFILLGFQCYFFSTSKTSWKKALQICKDKNSDLAHPQNEDENSQLVNYLQNNINKTDFWWFGASDTTNEGSWVWAHDNSALKFNNWIEGEPNGSQTKDEDCLHYWISKNGWNDINCETELQYACQENSKIA